MSVYDEIDPSLPIKEWLSEHKRITKNKISEKDSKYYDSYVTVDKDIKEYEDNRSSKTTTSSRVEQAVIAYRNRKHPAVIVSGSYAVGSLIPKPAPISEERKKANREWVAAVRAARDSEQD